MCMTVERNTFKQSLFSSLKSQEKKTKSPFGKLSCLTISRLPGSDLLADNMCPNCTN